MAFVFRGLPILVLMLLALLGAGEAPAAVDSEAVPEDPTVEAKFLFAIAQELRQEGDYEGARAAFEAALAGDPTEPFLRLSYAEFLYQLGELAAASEQASIARESGNRPEAIRLMARIELRQADKSTAAVHNAARLFSELSELLPEDIEARVSLGRLLMSLGRFDEAVAPLKEAYDLRPGDMRLASMLITALRGTEDRAATERSLGELVERYPDFFDARLALGNLLAEDGRHAESVAVLEAGRTESPGRVELLRLLALELYRLGEWQRSLDISREWLDLAPGETSAVYLEGLALSALGRLPEAESALRKLYDADQTSLDVARVLAEVVERQVRPAEAAEILSQTASRLEALGKGDLATRARLELIDLEVRSRNWEKVIELTAILAASPQLPAPSELLLVRGEALLEAGRLDESIELLGSLGDDAAVGDRAQARQAEALFRAGRPEAGQEKLLRLVEKGELEHVVLAARALHRLEQYERAIPLWINARGLDPQALDIRFWLASAYERSGQRRRAIDEFQELLAEDDLFAPALNYLGYMWAERGENLAEAIALIQKAVALEPNNGAYLDSLGWAYYQQGEYERALEYLVSASRLVTDDAVVFEHLGDLYVALGRSELAAESYQRAMALGGENVDSIQQKLDRLAGDS